MYQGYGVTKIEVYKDTLTRNEYCLLRDPFEIYSAKMTVECNGYETYSITVFAHTDGYDVEVADTRITEGRLKDLIAIERKRSSIEAPNQEVSSSVN